MPQKIKLSAGPGKTAIWIWLATNGQIKVEFYDFSQTAQRMFGNDIACTITVGEIDKLFSAIQRMALRSSVGWRKISRVTLASGAGWKKMKLDFQSKEKAGHDHESEYG